MNFLKLKLFNTLIGIGILVCYCSVSFAQQSGKTDAIYSGVPWYDQNGKVVSAHGANIIKVKDKFYLFGEAHTDTSNAFVGLNCYSSKDLNNWKFERIALPIQSNGKLGPNRVGERPKVMKNPQTGLYLMYMHVDTLGYKDQFVGYAIAKNVTGPYVDKDGKSLNEGGGSLVVQGDENYFGAGHNSAYTFDGKDYIFYHAYEKKTNGVPRLVVKEMLWDADLWPVLK